MRINTGIRLALAAAVLAWPTLASAGDAPRFAMADEAIPANSDTSTRLAPSSPAGKPQGANFLGEVASNDARLVADWVVASGDNHGLPFAIVDKIRAKVFVFDNVGQLRGATFALLGTARGDDSVPGIGSRKLSAIGPQDRTTPAGRFVAALGHDFKQDILWIDYGASISMHRVITGNPGDHRLQRLATPSPLDKRITYGCINVPVKFYEDVVLKTFTGTNGVIYILPEIKKIADVFAMSGVKAPDR
ncbi:MAG: hypothetical protein WDM86_03465 [Rhizomicrobium sp.]